MKRRDIKTDPLKIKTMVPNGKGCRQSVPYFRYNNQLISNILMQFSNINTMRIVELLKDRKLADEIVEQGEKTYKLQKNQLGLITTTFIVDYFQKQQKFRIENGLEEKSATHGGEQSWNPNQLKIFTWAILSYAHLQNKALPQFNDEDMLAVAHMFPTKAINFIRYHHLCLCKASARQTRCEWREEEISLLTNIIQSNKFERKWSDIAYQLYCLSGLAFFKTSHQCREKWFNHLNPSLSKEKWTIDEDIELFRNAKELGTKWAKISKAMGQYRTQHMVKNRFKSIAKKYENRYQRCTIKKRIQNILKDLQLKRITSKQKAVTENAQSRIEQEQSFETGKKESESVENNKETATKVENNLQGAVIEQNKEPQVQEEQAPKQYEQHQNQQAQSAQPTQAFNKIQTAEFEAPQFDFAQEKYEFTYHQGAIVNLRQDPTHTHSDVMLIDYLHMDFQARNKTIFSGSVE